MKFVLNQAAYKKTWSKKETWAKRQARVFMTIKKNSIRFILLIAIALCSFDRTNSSQPESTRILSGGSHTSPKNDQAQNAFPDILINLNYPDYRTLLYNEGYKQI